MAKIIAHIDLNAFFVRAEEIRNPKLVNRPVAIGGDGRGGIVSTCSYKAREYGVRSGMPMFKAKELCPELIIVPGDYLYYEVLSNEFFQVISKYSRVIEEASIDECYVDFTNRIPKGESLYTYFKQIQDDVFKSTGLKCSIGISVTKFLAKMGSDIKKPMGITIIPKKEIANILFNRDVGTYYGIGKTTEKLLKNYQISTIGQLYSKIKQNDPQIMELFGKYALEIIEALEGRSSNVVSTSFDDPKSISCRTTLPSNTSDFDELLYYLNRTFDNVKRRFNKTKLLAGGIEIAFRFVDFKTKTYSKKLEFPTNNIEVLREEIIELFKKRFKESMELRQIGCAFERLVDSSEVPIQMTLFNFESYSETDPTTEIISNFNHYFEQNEIETKLFRASDLLEKEKKDEN